LLGFFIWRTIVIKSHQAVVQNYCTKLEAHIKSGMELRKALQQLVPVFNKATVEQQLAIRNEVAQLIGKLKGIKPKLMEKGSYKGSLGFDAHGSEIDNQARVMMQTYLPCKKKKPKGSTQQVAKQVDAVEALLATLYKLSAKEQARFDVQYAKDKKAKARK
jgi:hypothetical protein